MFCNIDVYSDENCMYYVIITCLVRLDYQPLFKKVNHGFPLKTLKNGTQENSRNWAHSLLLKQIDSTVTCICSVIDHRWHQNKCTVSGTLDDNQVCHWCSHHILAFSVMISHWTERCMAIWKSICFILVVSNTLYAMRFVFLLANTEINKYELKLKVKQKIWQYEKQQKNRRENEITYKICTTQLATTECN